MNYPEDNLFKLIEVYNPGTKINRNTVYMFRDKVERLDQGKFKYRTKIYSRPGSIYYGEETISYDKYNMTSYSAIHPLIIPSNPSLRGWDVIDLIEKQYGFKLRREDIVNCRISSHGGVKLANLCILYEGIIQTIYEGSVELEDIIIESELDGFHLEI